MNHIRMSIPNSDNTHSNSNGLNHRVDIPIRHQSDERCQRRRLHRLLTMILSNDTLYLFAITPPLFFYADGVLIPLSVSLLSFCIVVVLVGEKISSIFPIV